MANNQMSSEQRRRRMAALLKRQGGVCFYCLRTIVPSCVSCGPLPKNTATLDHLVPKSKNGSHGLINLVAACSPCNEKRGDEDFYSDTVQSFMVRQEIERRGGTMALMRRGHLAAGGVKKVIC